MPQQSGFEIVRQPGFWGKPRDEQVKALSMASQAFRESDPEVQQVVIQSLHRMTGDSLPAMPAPNGDSDGGKPSAWDEPMVSLSSAVTQPDKSQPKPEQFVHGLFKGAAEGEEQLTTPRNVATLGTMVASNLIPVVGEVVDAGAGAYFTYQMAKNIVNSVPEAKKAFEAGDWGKVGTLLGRDVLTALIAKRGAERTGTKMSKIGRAIGKMKGEPPMAPGSEPPSSPKGITPGPRVYSQPPAAPAEVRSLPAGSAPPTPVRPVTLTPEQLAQYRRSPEARQIEPPPGYYMPPATAARPPLPPSERAPIRPTKRWTTGTTPPAPVAAPKTPLPPPARLQTKSPAAVPTPATSTAEPPAAVPPETLPAAAGPVPASVASEVANIRATAVEREMGKHWEQVKVQPVGEDLRTPVGEPITVPANGFTPEAVWALLSKAKGAVGIMVSDPVGGVASGIVRRRINLREPPGPVNPH